MDIIEKKRTQRRNEARHPEEGEKIVDLQPEDFVLVAAHVHEHARRILQFKIWSKFVPFYIF